MIDYNQSYEQYRVGVYNEQAYYDIEGRYFVRETSSMGGIYTDRLISIDILPLSLIAA